MGSQRQRICAARRVVVAPGRGGIGLGVAPRSKSRYGTITIFVWGPLSRTQLRIEPRPDVMDLASLEVSEPRTVHTG